MQHIFNLIKKERERQTELYGEQNHDFPVWATILGEEVGEVNKAIYERHVAVDFEKNDKITELKNELVQVAAVSVQMLEYIERNQENEAIDL